MDTSTTLKEQIQALMDSLADTALSAAESRHQSQAGEAHLLYALYRNDGLVGSILRGHGLESSEIRLLMSDIPNHPLTDRVRISALRKTGDHQARIAILSGGGGVEVVKCCIRR